MAEEKEVVRLGEEEGDKEWKVERDKQKKKKQKKGWTAMTKRGWWKILRKKEVKGRRKGGNPG